MYSFKVNVSILISLLITILVSAPCNAGSETSIELDVNVPDYLTTEGIVRYAIKSRETKEKSFRESYGYDFKSYQGFVELSELYESYATIYHYTKSGNIIYTADKTDCFQAHDVYSIVPELNSAYEAFLPSNINFINSGHVIGPTRFLVGIKNAVKVYGKPKLNREEEHRGLKCKVYRLDLGQTKDGKKIRFEAYLPANIMEETSKWAKTSIMAFSLYVSHNLDNEDETSRLSLDYFTFVKPKSDSWMQDFTLPLGIGCSAYLEDKIDIDLGAQSKFGAIYMQSTDGIEGKSHFLAFNSDRKLIRRDVVGISSTIYDLNHHLLYHTDDRNIYTVTNARRGLRTTFKKCAVSDINEYNFVPQINRTTTKSVNDFLDLKSLSRMGVGFVRGLSCEIYEKAVTEAPAIFFMRLENDAKIEYIYQVYLIKSFNEQPGIGNLWWPARLVLKKRSKGKIFDISVIDIYDFSPLLSGWRVKSSELFDARDCFDDEHHRVRVEMAAKTNGPGSANLKQRKYLLEDEAVGLIADTFSVPRPHISGMTLEVERNHLDFSAFVADSPIKVNKLEYFGRGYLPASVINKIDEKGIAENDCVLYSTLFDDVSMVLSCPGDSEGPLCRIVYSLDKPALDVVASETDEHSCQAYRFNTFDSIHHSRSIIEQMERDEEKLNGKKWQIFDDKIKVFDGTIVAHEITRQNDLRRIDESMFATDDVNVSLENINFVDCNRACQLDLSCQAYCFCSGDKSGIGLCSLTSKGVVYGSWLFVKKEQQQQQGNQTDSASANYDVPENRESALAKGTYKLIGAKSCTIYEKNHIDMYSKTNDFIYVEKSVVASYIAMTLDVCARDTNLLEHDDSSEYHPTFAYCGHPKVCLADLTKIVRSEKTVSDSTDYDGLSSDEQQMFENYERCRIYRKRYQSYFQVSTKIFIESSANVKQVKIQDKSVEECAHMCWQQDTNQDCHSFDHCVTKSDDGKINSVCSINTVTNDNVNSETTSKSGCFHYEKDHSLHQLRQRIGSTTSQDAGRTHERSGSNLTTGSYLLMLLLLIIGILVGDKVNPILLRVASGVYNGSVSNLRTTGKRMVNGKTMEEATGGVAMNVINRKYNDKSLLRDEL